MKYSLEWLLSHAETQGPLKYLYFWGHQPRPDGQPGPSCMSQWWLSAFEVGGHTYPTAEHWMMAEKARLFQDNEVLNQILGSKHPDEAKKLGRKVRGFDSESWNAARFEIVKTGNIHKFSQNPDLKAYLLNTGDRILVEASPYDKIWGVGLTADDERISQPENWDGLNLLGFALMEARDVLRTQSA